jgi:hypothetical protein
VEKGEGSCVSVGKSLSFAICGRISWAV